jgi:cytochrome c556
MSKLPWAAFVEGSGAGDTKAKAEIWSDNAKFKAAAEKMQGEMSKLAVPQPRAATWTTSRPLSARSVATCKACHDDFRKD